MLPSCDPDRIEKETRDFQHIFTLGVKEIEMTRNEQRISTGPAQIGDLDYVLTEVGEFRKYQIFHFILMSLPIILSIAFAMEFVVTSSSANYR